jgi:hypothetical protein
MAGSPPPRTSVYDAPVRTITAVFSGFVLAFATAAGCVPLERDGEKADRLGSSDRPNPKSSSKAPRPAVAQKRSKRNQAKSDAESDELLTVPFSDSFDRSALGSNWLATSGEWQIRDGRVCVVNAHNHPLWLKRRLPTNASIEFTATSASGDGDIKVEVWGDGHSVPKKSAYRDASSYLIVFGGWRNRFHVLARLDEHSRQRPEIRVQPGGPPNTRPVEPGRAYRFRVVRSDGKTVKWYVDGVEILSYVDAAPLTGAGHDHFAFNDWATPVCFDDLKITPLDAHGSVRD